MSFLNVNVNDKKTFLVRLHWIENTAEISLFDYESVKTWKGKLDEDHIQRMASQLDHNLADYKAKLDKCLLEASTHYTFTLFNNELTIKEVASDATYRICNISLDEIPLNESLPEFMSVITSSINQLRSKSAANEKLLDKVTKERDEAMKRCEEYVEIKETIEGHLYGQFAEAFNTLKIKMNAIKDTEEEEMDLSGAQQEESATALPSKKHARTIQDDDEDSDRYSDDTDVD